MAANQHLWVGPDDEPDRYRLSALLGGGGEGDVWVAYPSAESSSSEPVAIKILPPLGGTESIHWLSEANGLTQIRHPGLVRVVDYFVGRPMHGAGEATVVAAVGQWRYLVMAYIDGLNYAEWLVEHRDAPITERLRPLRLVASAIDHLGYPSTPGTQVIVHGDIKPSNIVIANDGMAVLVDLGPSATESTVRRSASFTAPELAQKSDAPTRQSDAFSFYLTAAAGVLGHIPGPTDTGVADIERITAALRDRSTRSGEVPLIERLVAAFTAPPEARPRPLRRWFDQLLSGLSTETDVGSRPNPSAKTEPRDSTGSRSGRLRTLIPRRRRGWLIGSALVAVLMLVAAMTIALLPRSSGAPTAPKGAHRPSLSRTPLPGQPVTSPATSPTPTPTAKLTVLGVTMTVPQGWAISQNPSVSDHEDACIYASDPTTCVIEIREPLLDPGNLLQPQEPTGENQGGSVCGGAFVNEPKTITTDVHRVTMAGQLALFRKEIAPCPPAPFEQWVIPTSPGVIFLHDLSDSTTDAEAERAVESASALPGTGGGLWLSDFGTVSSSTSSPAGIKITLERYDKYTQGGVTDANDSASYLLPSDVLAKAHLSGSDLTDDSYRLWEITTDGKSVTEISDYGEDADRLPLISPVTRVYTPQPIISTATAKGSCHGDSVVNPTAPAYACYALQSGNSYDPCYALADSKTKLFCANGPWGDGVTLTLTHPLPHHGPLPTSGMPWAIELANGGLCVNLGDDRIHVLGTVLNYDCSFKYKGVGAGYGAAFDPSSLRSISPNVRFARTNVGPIQTVAVDVLIR